MAYTLEISSSVPPSTLIEPSFLNVRRRRHDWQAATVAQVVSARWPELVKGFAEYRRYVSCGDDF